MEEGKVREHLSKLDCHKPMGCDGRQPQTLKEVADVTARPLSVIFAWTEKHLMGFSRRGPGGPGGHQAEHESATWPCCQEGQWYSGLH